MECLFSFIYKQNMWHMLFGAGIAIVLYSWVSLAILKHSPILQKALNAIFAFLIVALIAFDTLVRKGNVWDVQLIPFHFLIEAKTQSEIYRSVFMNVLLFVPLGLFMPYAISDKCKRCAVWITILFAAVLSATIEFLQWRFNLGRCETDDVIFNTLGAAAGSLSFILYQKIKSNRERSGAMSEISQTQKILLNICGSALFGCAPQLSNPDYPEILKEAEQQTVFPLVENTIRKDFSKAQPLALKTIAKNIRVKQDHIEIHKLLSGENIPYTILKGLASARYYPEPLLRTMGDVDFIVGEKDFAKTDRLLRQAGFKPTHEDSIHIEYQRKTNGNLSVFEMHRQVNGIPKGEAQDKFHSLLNYIIESAQLCEDGYFVPSDFHHGLILLLHTASHLTHEGIGVRHLCDWCVFASHFSDDEFTAMFEQPLKSVGLWEFARALNAVCVKFLGAPEKIWSADVDNALIDALILDVLNGGNFGQKDTDRYNQIKFIANRDNNKVESRSAILQLFHTLNQKAKGRFRPVALRPLGWLIVSAEYLYMLLSGKRDIKNIQKTVKDAAERKEIYSKLHLFDL